MKNKNKDFKKTLTLKSSRCHNNSGKSPSNHRNNNSILKNDDKEQNNKKMKNINLSLKEVFYNNLIKVGESFPYDQDVLDKKRKLTIDFFGNNTIINNLSHDSYYSATSPKMNNHKPSKLSSIGKFVLKTKVNPILLTKKDFQKEITKNFEYSFSKYLNKQIIKKV